MALAERAELVARLSLKDDFSAKLRNASKSVQGLDKAFSRTQTSLAKTGQNIGRIGVVLGTAAVGGFIAAAKAAGDFEAQLNTINTIARATPVALGKIGDSIRQIARDTGTPLTDLTQGYYDLLSAGIKAADATKVLAAANTLAIGGLSTTAEAVDLLTTAINVYGGDATKAGAYADIFAKAVERGKVTADEIAGSFSQVGAIAASSGLEINELAAAYARLTAGGTAAAEVSTQMRSAIVALTKRTPDLEKLEKATKKNYLAIAGSKGLVAALQEMRTDAEKSGVPLIDLLGRVEGLNFTLATTGPNFAAYNADLAAMGDAAGTAAAQMGERQKGLNFALARLKALALDAGITIGNALLPKLVPLVEKLNDLITRNQDKIASFGTSLASGFERVATALGKVNWQPFIDGLKLSSDIAKSTIGIFRSLPEGLQAALVGGFALNKVTGGLGTSIVKDLGGILLKQFAGRGSTPANPLFVANVTGGLGGGGLPAAAGAGGTLGKLLKVAIVGAVVVEGLKLWMDSFTPFIDRNNALADQGLTAGEIEAQKYYTADKATQDQIFKHLGRIPSKDDWLSGLAKLNGDTVTNGAPGSPVNSGQPGAPGSPANNGLLGATSAAAIAAEFGPHSIAASLFTSTLAEIIAGIKKRSAERFGGTGLGASAVDATFQRDILRAAHEVATSSAGLSTKVGDLKSLQTLLTQNGDTAAAAKIQTLIDTLTPGAIGLAVAKAMPKNVSLSPDDRGEIRAAAAAQRAAAEAQRLARLNVTVNVSTKVTVRDYVRSASIVSKYGFVAS